MLYTSRTPTQVNDVHFTFATITVFKTNLCLGYHTTSCTLQHLLYNSFCIAFLSDLKTYMGNSDRSLTSSFGMRSCAQTSPCHPLLLLEQTKIPIQ
jgi:hypothetical protein